MSKKLMNTMQLLATVGTLVVVGVKLYTAIKAGRNPVMAAGDAAKSLA